MTGGRVDAGEYARRVNAAAALLDSGVGVGEAAHILSERFGCSPRQARRYAQRAEQVGRVVVPQETTVFTVKLPSALVTQIRQRAQESGVAISAVVTQALTEFLNRPRKGLRK